MDKPLSYVIEEVYNHTFFESVYALSFYYGLFSCDFPIYRKCMVCNIFPGEQLNFLPAVLSQCLP
jgi:hypothetical protein